MIYGNNIGLLIFQMYVARVSNIMGIDSKPFDPNTYVEEEEHFITDETGHKQRIRLEDNVVRWRRARGRNGSINVINFFFLLNAQVLVKYSCKLCS